MSTFSQNPIPQVHPAPGGFVVVTPLAGRFVVESFAFVPNGMDGPVSSPLLHWTVDADAVDAEVAEHKQEIARHCNARAVTL